jgi:exosortase/archaeosortase family protein
MVKNGLRIVVLSYLGAYVYPAILKGALHRNGGIPFFVLSLVALAGTLLLVRRSERADTLQAAEQA